MQKHLSTGQLILHLVCGGTQEHYRCEEQEFLVMFGYLSGKQWPELWDSPNICAVKLGKMQPHQSPSVSRRYFTVTESEKASLITNVLSLTSKNDKAPQETGADSIFKSGLLTDDSVLECCNEVYTFKLKMFKTV